ncbi:MAG: hypothetical protein IPJ98_10390 [Bryobacterales bacterium]|nr:hypothetical protein [Bryobacterales bacterium]
MRAWAQPGSGKQWSSPKTTRGAEARRTPSALAAATETSAGRVTVVMEWKGAASCGGTSAGPFMAMMTSSREEAASWRLRRWTVARIAG